MGLHRQQWLWRVAATCIGVAACGTRAAHAALHQGGECMHIGQIDACCIGLARLMPRLT